MVFEVITDLSNKLLSPILNPILNLPPTLTILIVALFISVVSVLAQKKFTDQNRLKFLKKETKKLQEEVRKYKDDPAKQLKVNKKMMPLQGEMMKASLKPTLWMMLPFLLIFLWLSAHFAFEPLLPGENFTITADVETTAVLLEAPEGLTVHTPLEVNVTEEEATWIVSGVAGEYILTFSADDSLITKDVLITEEKAYATVMETYKGDIKRITLGNAPLKPIDPFTIFNWHPGWIWIYIFFSLVFSISLRKWLDVA